MLISYFTVNGNDKRYTCLGGSYPVYVLDDPGTESITSGSVHIILTGLAVYPTYTQREFHAESVTAAYTGSVNIIQTYIGELTLISLVVILKVIISGVEECPH